MGVQRIMGVIIAAAASTATRCCLQRSVYSNSVWPLLCPLKDAAHVVTGRSHAWGHDSLGGPLWDRDCEPVNRQEVGKGAYCVRMYDNEGKGTCLGSKWLPPNCEASVVSMSSRCLRRTSFVEYCVCRSTGKWYQNWGAEGDSGVATLVCF